MVCKGHGKRFFYANICWLTITLARGKHLRKKMLLRQNKEPSASQGFGQRDVLQLCSVESATSRLFFSQGRKVNLQIDRTAENVVIPMLFQTEKAETNANGLQSKEDHMIVYSLFLPDCHNCLPQVQNTYNDTANTMFLPPCNHLVIKLKK